MSSSNCCFLTCTQISQEAGKVVWLLRNINNLRYADDTTFMGENEEGLKNLLMKVKEVSEKVEVLVIQLYPTLCNPKDYNKFSHVYLDWIVWEYQTTLPAS